MNPIGIQAQLVKIFNPFLLDGENVIFDTVLASLNCGCEGKCNCDINYRRNTGEFIIKECGTYLVNWSVAVEGSYSTSFIRFALKVNNDIYGAVASPISTGLINGSALVKLKRPNTTVSLTNDTGDVVRLADITPIANIVISKT